MGGEKPLGANESQETVSAQIDQKQLIGQVEDILYNKLYDFDQDTINTVGSIIEEYYDELISSTLDEDRLKVIKNFVDGIGQRVNLVETASLPRIDEVLSGVKKEEVETKEIKDDFDKMVENYKVAKKYKDNFRNVLPELRNIANALNIVPNVNKPQEFIKNIQLGLASVDPEYEIFLSYKRGGKKVYADGVVGFRTKEVIKRYNDVLNGVKAEPLPDHSEEVDGAKKEEEKIERLNVAELNLDEVKKMAEDLFHTRYMRNGKEYEYRVDVNRISGDAKSGFVIPLVEGDLINGQFSQNVNRAKVTILPHKINVLATRNGRKLDTDAAALTKENPGTDLKAKFVKAIEDLGKIYTNLENNKDFNNGFEAMRDLTVIGSKKNSIATLEMTSGGDHTYNVVERNEFNRNTVLSNNTKIKFKLNGDNVEYRISVDGKEVDARSVSLKEFQEEATRKAIVRRAVKNMK